MVRRRELTRLFPGVYLAHTGEPTWLQRAWGAVLYAWPAALAGSSAIRAAERVALESTADAVIEVAVDAGRAVRAQRGIRVVRRTRFAEMVRWNLQPPRLHYDEAVLDVACESPDEVDAVAVLAGACASRRTPPARLLARMDERSRIRGRAWLRGVLVDISAGTHSALEHGFLHRVEKAHGLPAAQRQLRSVSAAAGVSYRDADLGMLLVELDGRAYHSSTTQRDDDLERDLDVLVEERRPTVRLGWRQVYRHPCRTAVKLAAVLRRLGWDGVPVPCGEPGCLVR